MKSLILTKESVHVLLDARCLVLCVQRSASGLKLHTSSGLSKTCCFRFVSLSDASVVMLFCWPILSIWTAPPLLRITSIPAERSGSAEESERPGKMSVGGELQHLDYLTENELMGMDTFIHRIDSPRSSTSRDASAPSWSGSTWWEICSGKGRTGRSRRCWTRRLCVAEPLRSWRRRNWGEFPTERPMWRSKSCLIALPLSFNVNMTSNYLICIYNNQ